MNSRAIPSAGTNRRSIQKLCSVFLLAIMMLALLLPMAAMAEGEATESVPITSITLDKSAVTTSKGQTICLIADIDPEESSELITWTSSDETVATVDADGIVAFIVGTLIGVAIHSYIKKRKE